ncbi:hypothetical protein [Sphingomonas lenta]|uniref:Uncharacterized protein n=1 Tax=Sphingomonas lenta TaxID=1141887 RepID=A0A2A2SL34_9SPHN|nr:hypothetical protein [Sphingomonas lenta]PAX09731.1 hypothetical protein CKY28_03100 [Sphingomonas lenta]
MTNLIRTDTPAPRSPLRQGYLVRGSIAPVFVERGALSPTDAIAFKPSSPREAKAFAALLRSGAMRQAGGNWWLDIVAYQANANARSRAAIPWLIGGAVLIALAAMLFYRG